MSSCELVEMCIVGNILDLVCFMLIWLDYSSTLVLEIVILVFEVKRLSFERNA
jgi:hypothetical protein